MSEFNTPGTPIENLSAPVSAERPSTPEPEPTVPAPDLAVVTAAPQSPSAFLSETSPGMYDPYGSLDIDPFTPLP